MRCRHRWQRDKERATKEHTLERKPGPVNYIVMSDPDLVISNAGGLKSSTSAFISAVDNRKALIPPPLPPKHHRRSPAFEKTLDQAPFNSENKPLNSLVCHTSPVLGGVKENNQCLDLVPGEIPGMHNGCIFGILPKVDPKCQKQFSPRPPQSTLKPLWPNNSKMAETEEGRQGRKQEAECRKLKEQMEDKQNRQGEQDLTEIKEKTEENEETSQIESHLDVGKPPRIIVLYTDKETGGEDGEDRGKEDEGTNNIVLTTPSVTENSSLLVMGCSVFTPDDEPDTTPSNRNYTSAVSAKPEARIPPHPPPKPHRKYPPKTTINPPQLFSSMRAVIEEENERRKQEAEQWRDKDLEEKQRDEKEGEVKDRGKVSGDTESTTPTMTQMPFQPGEIVMSIPKSSMNQEVELPGGGEKFCLKPPCRNRPTPVITPRNETLLHEYQHPGKQHPYKANGQVQPVPPSQEVPAPVNPIGADSNMETLKWREKNKEIQMSGQGVQDSEVISKLSSGHQEETEAVGIKLDPCRLVLKRSEDTQEIAETLPGGQQKQTKQKVNARGKMKQLAKKVTGRLKAPREEKRRIKAVETQDERRHGEEEGTKGEDKKEGMDETAVDQSAVPENQSHADLDRRIKRRNATSESPFSSFKVCSPVNLVGELLSGDEWSQFLYEDQSSKHEPPPSLTHSEDSGELSESFQLNSSAELDLALDVFEGNPAVPEEPIYEDMSLSNVITEESQTHEQQEWNRASITAIPTILLESETDQMSPRTKDIYDTVEFIQPVLLVNTHVNHPDVQGVLDSAVQKYLIKLSKKRKHRAARKRRGNTSDETLGLSPPSTSPQQVFPASIFYNVPASGGGEQLPTVKSGGSSPRSLPKTKTALKEKNM